MDNELTKLIQVAQIIGAKPEYVQGGGGNVSIKDIERNMAVKASGFRLGDLDATKGFVTVDFLKVRDFYKSPFKADETIGNLIAQSDEVISNSIISENAVRPSIETGFHAILGNCVIHSHSVYANILTCSKEGEVIVSELFPDAIFVPYNTPGVTLTIAIDRALKNRQSNVIFLKNHGLITIGDSVEEAYKLHESTNDSIKKYFSITDPYPTISIEQSQDGFVSNSKYISDFILNNNSLVSDFSKTILFPDQVVYGENIGFAKNDKAITLNLENGTIEYKVSHNEALSCEETIASWMYIVDSILHNGHEVVTLSETEGKFITNLESEKYRKSIV